MKYGYRAPSIKKSISSRTTGKVNRSINKAINPLYGKKGMGYINNPKKAIYNSIYNKTTFGTKDILKDNIKNELENNDGFNNNERKLTIGEKIMAFIGAIIIIIGGIITVVPYLLIIYAIFWVIFHI